MQYGQFIYVIKCFENHKMIVITFSQNKDGK